MARLTDLPPEIVEDIISYVFLGDQFTSSSLEGFTHEETSPLIGIRAQCIIDYAKSKIISGSFTDGVFAVHACPGNDAAFHGILHRMFYEQRCRRNGLLALSLTSKWFHSLVEPILWGTVELDRDRFLGPRPAKDLIGRPIDRLLLALLKRPELGLSVKSFAFEQSEPMPIGWHDLRVEAPREGEVETIIRWNDHPGIENPDLSDLLPEDSPNSSKELVYWTRTSNILSHFPNLRSLNFSINYSDGPFGIYTFSKSFISRLSGLQNLTELSMIWLGTSSIEFASFVKLFFLPSLRVLYLSDFIFDEQYGTDGDDDIIPHIPVELRRKSEVTDLTLDFSYVESGPLIALLQLPAALEKFVFGFIAEGIYHRNPSAGRFFDLLYPHRSSLREIDIVGCRDVRNAGSTARPFSGRCAKQVLKDFPVLKKLGCPAETLKTSWDSDENMWVKDLWFGNGLTDVLPASLESLRLYIYDDWSIGGWSLNFSHVFERKALGFPGVKEIWVEYWVAGDEIDGDSPPERLQMIREWIENLKIGAANAGIDLQVRVDKKNKTILD